MESKYVGSKWAIPQYHRPRIRIKNGRAMGFSIGMANTSSHCRYDWTQPNGGDLSATYEVLHRLYFSNQLPKRD